MILTCFLGVLDMYDNATKYISDLKKEDHIVMCYISVGTLEGFRSFYKKDPSIWEGLTLGTMASWHDEKWIDIRQLGRLIPIMESRFDHFASLGCDAIEPDNMDCYGSSECGLSRDTSIEYALVIASLAHNRNMSIVAKNAIELYPTIEPFFDGAVVENCAKWKECQSLTIWKDHDKGVFSVEYDDTSDICNESVGVSKYCSGNKGRYLCVDKQWSNCRDATGPMAPTQHVVDGTIVVDSHIYV